jgi:cell surface protein SprA
VEFKKQRNLALNLSSTQLIEADADEFVIGVGYVVNDFKLPFKGISSKSSIKNDLKLSADVSYKDIKTLLRKVNENLTQASSGNKVISIKCMADYVFSSKVNLQLFFDKQSTVPLISSTYPVSTTNFGLSFRFMLTR